MFLANLTDFLAGFSQWHGVMNESFQLGMAGAEEPQPGEELNVHFKPDHGLVSSADLG
jgi:hypothetical protein